MTYRDRDPGAEPFGIAVAAAMLLGGVAAVALPALPARGVAFGLAVIGALLWWRGGPPRTAGAAIFGFGWLCVVAAAALAQRVPESVAGTPVVADVRVLGLPEREAARMRFDVAVESGALAGRRLRLSWYGASHGLAAGERWTLVFKPRPPRGLRNPGGGDFERRALAAGIDGGGHVLESPAPVRREDASGLDAWRSRIADDISTTLGGAHAARHVAALALADTRAMTDADWERLRVTGTIHLFAISGLHVGLVAGLGALLARLVHRLVPPVGLWLPLPQSAALASLAAAAAYTALAGFALPTVRTLLMIAAALLAVLLRRPLAPGRAFALALVAVLIVDPLSLLAPGFWLSFAGVAWLLLCLPDGGTRRWLRSAIAAQAVLTVGLLPLTAWFFAQASVVGPLANMVAVPWVTLLVVPLSLAGTGALMLGADALATPLLWLAAAAMRGLDAVLAWCAALPGAAVMLPEPDAIALMLAALGALWLLMPRGTPARVLGLVLFAPLVLPASRAPPVGAAHVHVLDVGQGLSVILRTARHALLYDTGPRHAGGFDSGDAIVVPALHALGIGAPDQLAISHGDNDHAGGAAAVLRAFASPRVVLGEPGRPVDGAACIAGERWTWDGVDFEWLHPPPHFPSLGNDSSCVLRVSVGGRAVLLPGDISETVEARLVATSAQRLRADAVIVPHHGSASSSSPAFVAAVSPRLALISAGRGNRFGHPRADVVARWTASGAHVQSTADDGATMLALDGDGVEMLRRERHDRRRFWQAR